MTDRHKYTVCFLFSHDLKKILLVRKNKTEYTKRLNGIGGELWQDELPGDCAERKIEEETGLTMNDLESLGLTRLAHLGTLSIPHDCKYNSGECVLYFYAGCLKPDAVPSRKTDTGEELLFEPLSDILNARVTETRYAGDGDLSYFVQAGHRTLLHYLPEQKGIKE